MGRCVPGRADPANGHLRTVRLADNAITVRELLTHTAGVASPGPVFTETATDLLSFAGPVMACEGTRGTFAPRTGGYAALGQLIADVTGEPYRDAATGLVLEPLRMTGSSFPSRWPGPELPAVTGYRLDIYGAFAPAPGQVSAHPAAAGLWTTASDLVRFGLGWSSLLPAALAREALRPQTGPIGDLPTRAALGWVINESIGAAGYAGGGQGTSASLVTRMADGRVYVALANRSIPIEPVNGRVVRATAGPDDPPMDDVVSDRPA